MKQQDNRQTINTSNNEKIFTRPVVIPSAVNMSGIKKFAKSKPEVEEEMDTEMDIIPAEVKEKENNEKTDFENEMNFENEIEEPKVPEIQ